MNKIELAKQLLSWKHKRLNKQSNINKDEIALFFSDQFIVIANNRRYETNHDSYLDFLNQFKSNINRLTHHVDEYLCAENTVIMPMKAVIEYDNDKITHYEAVMLLKYNEDNKIIQWREVAVEV